jgi:hypothetical protein
MDHENCGCTRRQMIRSLVSGSMMLPAIITQLLSDEARGAAGDDANPLAPKAPHFAARAKRVIFMCMSGGVSHIDTFDPKPRLVADAEKGVLAPGKRPYLRPHWDFKPNPKCGTEVSDLFPNVRDVMDEICLIRSMQGDHNDHFQATMGIHTGSVTFKRPSIGAWTCYGLGTVNQNLPGYVVLVPARCLFWYQSRPWQRARP